VSAGNGSGPTALPPAVPRLQDVRAALGRRIVGHRLARGWSQQALASGIGIPAPRMCEIENGHLSPNLVELLLLRAVLGASLDDLMVGPTPAAPATAPGSDTWGGKP
jgi:transcriptional regulator with XRE-family HTH domain